MSDYQSPDWGDVGAGTATGASVGTAVNPGIGTAVGAGVGFLGSMLMSLFNSHLEQENYEKNQQRQFELNQESEKNSAFNRVIGLRNAGLSTALANGNSTSAAVGSAPMQSRNMSMSDVLSVAALSSQLKLQDAQANNLNADAKKIEADTRKVDIENNRLVDEDVSSNANFRMILDKLRAEAEKAGQDTAGYDAFLESNELFSKGSIQGFDNANRVMFDMDDYKTRMYDNYVRRLVFNKQSLSDDVQQAIANKPLNDLKSQIAGMAMIAAEIQKSKAQTTLTEEQTRETVADVDKTIKEASNIYHHDFAGMIQNGDYGAAFLQLGFEALKAVSLGAGAAAGSRLGGSKPKPKPDAGDSPLRHFDPNSSVTGGHIGNH